MKKILLISITFFIACGKKDSPPTAQAQIIPEFQINPDLAPYYTDFKKRADAYGISYGDSHVALIDIKPQLAPALTANFASGLSSCSVQAVIKDGQAVGYFKEISIDPQFFTISNENFKTKIFLNAVGHCVYSLPFVGSEGFNGIMSNVVSNSNPEDLAGLVNDFFDDAQANEPNWNSTGPF